MRGGLRSGVAKAGPQAEQVLCNGVEVGEKVSGNHDFELKGIDGEENRSLNLELAGSGTEVSLQEVGEMKADASGEQQCIEDEDLGGIEKPALSRNVRERSRAGEVGGDCRQKKVKREECEQKVQICSRILRSSPLVKREELDQKVQICSRVLRSSPLAKREELDQKVQICSRVLRSSPLAKREELDQKVQICSRVLRSSPLAKREELDQKVQICSRVLRSSPLVKREELKEVDKEVTGGVLDQGLSTMEAGYDTVLEADTSIGNSQNKLKLKPDRISQFEGNDEALDVKLPEEKVPKPKRGRPFKAQENDEVSTFEKPPKEAVLKPKCGRPFKVPENDEVSTLKKPPEEEVLKHKRGRPLKVRENDEVSNVMPPKEEPPKRKRGRPCKVLGHNEVPNVEPLRKEVLQLESAIEEVHKVDHLKEIEAPEAELLMEDKVTEVEPLKEVEAPKVQEEKRKGILKRKRGRPPKSKVRSDSEEVPKGPGKCKRVKFDSGERNGLPEKSKRRGRPPKGQINNGALNTELNNTGMQKGFKITKKYLGRKPNGKKLNPRRFLPARKNKYGNMGLKDDKGLQGAVPKVVHAIIGKKHKGQKGVKTKLKEGKVGQTRNEQKQLVRDRIVDILLGAGWTVEHRQSTSRKYLDAVYVNPKGRTHWSVTLAYSKFLEQYEADQDSSNTGNIGFVFTPIPEEDLNILKKVIIKRRTRKELNQSRLSGDTSDEEVTKVKKHKEMPTRNRKRLGTQGKRRCALLARSSDGVESDIDNYTPYDGKRTVLAWMIDLGTVPLNVKVQYMNQRRTHIKLEGRLTMDGIHCECCSKIFTMTNFGTHAGNELTQPSENIYLENGSSLIQCQLDSWNKQGESEHKDFHSIDVDGDDPNDDTCGICGDGGDLICCDSCPSTFHQSCLDIQTFPSGDWLCVYCSCKYCGIARVRTPQGADSEIAISALLTCYMCQEKYHQSCVLPGDATPDSGCSPFCGKYCQELSQRLEMLIGVKHELEEGFSWTLVRRSDIKSDISQSGECQKIESNSKIAVALSVMNECFLPIIDQRSGINLIRNILMNSGSNFNRLNYSGFVTAILEKDDEIISAASIRIHSNQLAEMPFIGTRNLYRRQGMCRRLLTAIESALCSLRVEKLVIPAIPELMVTWTTVFGFKPIESSSRQKMRNVNMMVFPGVEMLQKPILNHSEEIFSSAGLELTDLVKEHHTANYLLNNSDERCSAQPDSNTFTGSAPCTVDKINDELATVVSVSQHHDGLLDTSGTTYETVNNVEHPIETEQVILSGDLKGENKAMSNSASVVHNVDNEPIEHQSDVAGCCVHASGMKTIEVDSQSNSLSMCERESCPQSEATKEGSEMPKCNTEYKATVDNCCDMGKVASSGCDDVKETSMAGGFCEDLKEAPDDKTDLKEAPTQLQTDLHSINMDSNSVQPLANANSSEQLKSGSLLEQRSVTSENSETLSVSSSGSGVAPICASGGCSTHSTPPEVMILSNQAS